MWVVPACVIFAVVALTEQSLLAPTMVRLDDEIDGFSALIDREELELGTWFGKQLQGQLIGTQALPATDLDGFLTDYLTALRLARTRTDGAARAAVDIRLWLLGDQSSLPDIDYPLSYYARLIIEDAPDSLHEALWQRVFERAQGWPTEWRWPRMTRQRRWDVLMHAVSDQLDRESRCLRMSAVTEDGQALIPASAPNRSWQEAGASRPGGWRAVDLVATHFPESTAERCLVKRVLATQGRQFEYGIVATDVLNVVVRVRQLGAIGAFVSLLIALSLALLLGRYTFSRLRSINTLTEQIRLGDLERRLALEGSGDDFDSLSENINLMLDRMQQLMDAVRQISDNIAHDLRSPLTRLRNRIEILSRHPAPTAQDVAPIVEQADEVLATFTDLLHIAQLEQLGQQRNLVSLDLALVAREVQDMFEPVFAQSHTELEVSTPAVARIMGDRNLWVQLLNNLLENVLKYAPDCARVQLSLRSDGPHWRLEVRDQGPGVPEYALQRLTERFYRVESHRGSPGTGLGLSLVAAICRLHGGELALVNDHGLVVRIHVPQAPSDTRSSV